MLQNFMDPQLQNIHNHMLPILSQYPPLYVGASYYAAANWVSLVNFQANQSDSCAVTKSLLRYALFLTGRYTVSNFSVNLQLQQLPPQFYMLQSKSCFGLGLKNGDSEADHFVFFFKDQNDNYVLVHSWQWKFSLHQWLNDVDLSRVANRELVKSVKPWRSPRQFILAFFDGWRKEVLGNLEGTISQEMKMNLQENITELLIKTVMKDKIKQIFWGD